MSALTMLNWHRDGPAQRIPTMLHKNNIIVQVYSVNIIVRIPWESTNFKINMDIKELQDFIHTKFREKDIEGGSPEHKTSDDWLLTF